MSAERELYHLSLFLAELIDSRSSLVDGGTILSVDAAHHADSMTPLFVLIEFILVDLLPCF